EKIDVKELLEACLTQCAAQIESKNLKVSCRFESIEFVGEREKLMQAFKIVLDAAVDRAPPSSPLEVKAKETLEKIEIDVTDNGVILDTVQQRHYFDRMSETQAVHRDRSHVLMLNLSRAILNAHEGSITIVHDGQSTSFAIRLPIKRWSDG
ncbi:MAG: ATP-binding protein, partial [Cyanobacteria bacterium]|nr:ATP-binding protein [Cyanobacteriota bacterium]